eukprot:CAMPEP_0170171374 /NCGR_PEP_ID=MMETSP0040_2-20121228/4514_1 /TAXON_ID=641309 /ORGANISM="Lotharella oceanica, Strain CCMP622" /LENGTH=51 /DNA_ID=CAMNT_0010411385 /DNA_START=457 /DNA_END=612 /DNA_ORIENTATION=+
MGKSSLDVFPRTLNTGPSAINGSAAKVALGLIICAAATATPVAAPIDRFIA